MTDHIKVPAGAVRTPEAILRGLLAGGAVFDEASDTVWLTCHNCSGTGRYPSSAIPAGRCRFYCWSNRTARTYGKLPFPRAKLVREAQRADRAAYRREVRSAVARQVRAERIERLDPRVEAALRTFKLDPRALPLTLDEDRWRLRAADLCYRWLTDGQLTDAQWQLLEKVQQWHRERVERLADRERERLAAPDAPTGRVQFVAEVLTVREVGEAGPRGNFYGPTWKMLAKAREGWKVWLTVPGAIEGKITELPGRTFELRATLERSRDDSKFAFGKRPTLVREISTGG